MYSLTIVEALKLVDSDLQAFVVLQVEVDAAIASIWTGTIVESEADELGVQGGRLDVAGGVEHRIYLGDNGIVRSYVETC